MQFESIEEIKTRFQLEPTDYKSLRKALKKIIKPIHPDKNGGEFKNDNDKNLYNDALDAISFIDNQKNRTELAVMTENQSISYIRNELSNIKIQSELGISIQNKVDNLSSKVQRSIVQFHSQHKNLKFTSATIALVATAFWSFPGIVKDHPILSGLIHYYKEFTVLWLTSLMVSGVLWIKIKSLERKEEKIKSEYKLESMQNRLFELFALWSYAIANSYDLIDKDITIRFSKEALMAFFVRRFEYYNGKYYLIMDGRHLWNKEKLIKEVEENYRNKYDKIHDQKIFRGLYLIKDLLPHPGEIDMELAESVCGLIIERLFAKKAINKVDNSQLIDYYQYKLPKD